MEHFSHNPVLECVFSSAYPKRYCFGRDDDTYQDVMETHFKVKDNTKSDEFDLNRIVWQRLIDLS